VHSYDTIDWSKRNYKRIHENDGVLELAVAHSEHEGFGNVETIQRCCLIQYVVYVIASLPPGYFQYFPAVFEVLKKLFPFISMADPFSA